MGRATWGADRSLAAVAGERGISAGSSPVDVEVRTARPTSSYPGSMESTVHEVIGGWVLLLSPRLGFRFRCSVFDAIALRRV